MYVCACLSICVCLCVLVSLNVFKSTECVRLSGRVIYFTIIGVPVGSCSLSPTENIYFHTLLEIFRSCRTPHTHTHTHTSIHTHLLICLYTLTTLTGPGKELQICPENVLTPMSSKMSFFFQSKIN